MELVKTVILLFVLSVIITPAVSSIEENILERQAKQGETGDNINRAEEEDEDGKKLVASDKLEQRELTIITGFVLSVAASTFFVLLRCCPPLCRQESKNLRRKYKDRQLQIGEIGNLEL